MWGVFGDDYINIHITLMDCHTVLYETILCFPDNGLTDFDKGIHACNYSCTILWYTKKYLILLFSRLALCSVIDI